MADIDGIVPALGAALTKRGYSVLTPVQLAVLAPEVQGADALVSAQTGSGKTVAFGINLAPTLLEGADRFGRAQAPLALVIAPTRELALQVKRELEWLYEMTGALVASCVGGMSMQDERRTLHRGAHIVVGTPGRLRDHIERGSLNTGRLKAVVLDEADEMLDLGFRDDLEYILDAAPAERRTLMFSATVPRAIANLAKRYQRDAVRISTTAETAQHVDIEYRALTIAPNDRENAIVNVLRYFDAKTALVFCGTRATVNHMTSRFNNRGFSVVALSGELSQNERTHALQAMRDGRARVCIATDVAARGIDLPNLDLVIHADLPRNGDALLHRSGRTGRAGRKGVSVLIVPHNWRKRTERLLEGARITAHWAKPPSVEDILKRDDQRILEDPTLSDPLEDNERAFAQALVAAHGAEQIAAAFVRMHRAGQSAPEELIDTGPAVRQADRHTERPGSRHENFKDSQWFRLSVGRAHQAEARWLLPMLCRFGHITKNEIGAIRIAQDETFVEIAAGGIDRFLDGIGPHKTLEKTIAVTRADGPPTLPPSAAKAPYDKAQGKKKPYKPGGFKEGGGHPGKKFTKKNSGKAERATKAGGNAKPGKANWADKPSHDAKPGKAERATKPGDDAKPGKTSWVDKPKRDGKSGQPGKPWEKSAKKTKDWTSKKPKLTGKTGPASAKPHNRLAPGSEPLKRKKPKRTD